MNEPSGSISGRVTLADKPAPGVTVLLASAENAPIEKPAAKATTDEDGRFRLTNLPAGPYLVQTFAPAFVGSTDLGSSRPAKAINLEEGESVEGVDIALMRGGVIPGRVTDAGEQPLVQEGARLIGRQNVMRPDCPETAISEQSQGRRENGARCGRLLANRRVDNIFTVSPIQIFQSEDTQE